MGFSDILDEIGGFGRFQWIHVILLSIPGLLMQNLLNNFTAGIPGHHCAIPNISNRTNDQNITAEQLSTDQLLRAFIPVDKRSSKFTKCTRYVEPQWHLAGVNITGTNFTEPETETCLDGWTYQKTEFISTIVSEWDLVCTLQPLKQMTQTIYMGGVLSGAIIFGGLSDKFGRRALLIWSYFQLAVLGTFTTFATSYVAYCVLRFLSGMAVSGIILNAVSLKVEWIPTKTRTLVGTLSSFFFTFGQMVLAGVAYSLKDWRKLHVAVCSPYFVFALYSWWYSESARWLVLNGKSEEAIKQIHRVARINGKPEMVEKINMEYLESHMHKEMQSSKTTHTAYDLLRTPVMRRISICLVAVWFSTSFAYYGLAMDLQKFGNIYVMQLLFGVVDIPAKLLALTMLSFLGRRITQASCLLISAVLIFANIFISQEFQTARTVLAVLGKGFTSSSFTCVYLFTGELYPTVLRQTGMGFTSTMSRIGSMAAPAVLILDEVLPALPSIVYGGAAVIAGVFALFLPETLNVPLPETVDDVEEKWSKKPHVQKQIEKESVALQDMKEGGAECEDGKTSGLNAL
ncbi:solute carrier family 22 member 6-A-like [Clupea harengus]|uniref:Solute carrier family 22 member 6 n=1 Tax=Clupea harengus TaxID=7950 RepID=A0A6P8FFR3_CLUHA|nr:solute carrier family 22 member 6-A-like [Clupea harengus]XP_031427244.1 solute carrier family 22 member 6-A-like [Clupea harengus]